VYRLRGWIGSYLGQAAIDDLAKRAGMPPD